jgi:hypothetical protein
MGFATSFNGNVGVLGDNTLVIGTAMLGDDFGSINNASCKRTADKEELEAASGNLRAVILKKPRFELTMEVLFDSSVTPPGLLDQITLPFAGVTGRVLDAEIKWEKGKERLLSITATHWDAIGTGVAYKLNTTTGVFTSMDA